MYRGILAFLFLSFVFLTFPSPTHAQEAGIKIVPAVIETAANPGEIITEEITVTNVNNEAKTFFLYTRNIQGVEANGKPIFSEEGAEHTGFEMSDWLSFFSESIDVEAGGEYKLPVTITIPENASPGSHFGGIFISAEPPRLRKTGAGVGYEVGAIVSIRIAGDITDNARIRSFSTNKLFFGTKDVEFLIKVENQGNILIRPRGPLTITNMFGGEVANLEVNDALAGVFPGTVRDLSLHWQEDEPGFGQYTAVVALSYEGDGGQKTIDAAVTFWIFPMKIIVPILLGLFALVGFIYLFTRLYISRAVARSTGSGRILSHRHRRRVGISRLAFVFIVVLSVVTLFLIVLLVLFA
jgi:hypothetical protein